MLRKKWNCRQTFKFGEFPEIECFGRQPFEVKNPAHRAALVSLGVFEDIGNDNLRYSGRATFEDKNGNLCQIDQEGYCEYEEANLDKKFADALAKEMVDDDNERK